MPYHLQIINNSRINFPRNFHTLYRTSICLTAVVVVVVVVAIDAHWPIYYFKTSLSYIRDKLLMLFMFVRGARFTSWFIYFINVTRQYKGKEFLEF